MHDVAARSVAVGAALALLASPWTARADEVAAEVKVTGTKRIDPVAASDIDIPIGRLADVPRRNAEQLLTLAPGLFLSNPSGEGHASTIFLRGFDAGEGQDVEMRLEGIPLNEPSNTHAHGYADTHFIIPELVERLRVIEGPYDPRQGDFAVAGSAEYSLGLAERGITTRGSYGSFGSRRFVALWGPSATTRRTFVGVDFAAGDGFGPNRAYASTRAMAQYVHDLGRGVEVTTLATSYATRFDTAGVVRQDDYAARRMPGCPRTDDAQFFCLVDPNQGGAASRHGVSVRIRKGGFEQQLFVTVRELRIRQNLTGFVSDTSGTGDPQRGDGIEQTYAATTVGARASYARPFAAFGRKHELELGTFARHDASDGTARRLRFAGGAPYRTTVDSGLGITNVAFYAALRFTPFDRLTIRGGARVDSFAFAVQDRNRPLVDRAGARLGTENLDAYGVAFQPKITADVRLNVPIHWVTAFGIGTRSSDAQALSDGEFAPFARVRALETGIVGRFLDAAAPDAWSMTTRAVAYQTRVERDLLFDENAGRNTPIGASNRFGALVAARFASAFGLDAQTSLTYAEAYLPPPDASALDLTAGVRLPYAPRWVGRIDAALRRSVTIRGETVSYGVSSGMSYVAPRPLPFGELGPAYGSVDAAIRVRYRDVELGIEGTNLGDRRNKVAIYNYASNFRGPEAFPSLVSQQHFAAGPPRMVLATLTVHLDSPEVLP